MSLKLETAALCYGLDAIWRRAGKQMPAKLATSPTLDENDHLRLQVAQRLVSDDPKVSTDPIVLETIFQHIQLDSKDSSSQKNPSIPRGYITPQVMRVTPNAYFPSSQKPDKNVVRQGYENIANRIERGLKHIQTHFSDNEAAYLEGLYGLMAHTLANVPYNAKDATVSFFDHNHAVTMLATCLKSVDVDTLRGWLGSKSFPVDEAPFATLISGDINGVQEFIYTLTDPDDAAKILRGRSFYLQILTDAALRYVLREIDLPLTSVVYAGGAKFYVMAPVEVDLDRIRRQVTAIMLRYHQRDLYLSLGAADVRRHDLVNNQADRAWKAAQHDLNRFKLRRYSELGPQDLYEAAFQPHQIIEDNSQYREIGENLVQKDRLYYTVIPNGSSTSRLPALSAFGLQLDWEEPAPGGHTLALKLSDGNHDYVRPFIYATRYTMNLEPTLFDTLGTAPTFVKEGQPHGIQRLGILRMDVDNLGTIFARGMAGRATLGRIMTLSRTIATFFEGRIEVLCNTVSDHYAEIIGTKENYIYGVYAGGDDVFIVGPWHLMPELAAQIRAEFGKLTLDHPQLTISAGIAVVPVKYPLYQAAHDGEEALDEAKKFEGKDAISFLDETYSWNDFRTLQRQQRIFVDAHRNDHLPMSVINALISLETTRRAVLRGKKVPISDGEQVGRWVWSGTYQLHRLHQQYDKRDHEQTAQNIRSILSQLQQDNFKQLGQMAYAARWAHLHLRRSQNS